MKFIWMLIILTVLWAPYLINIRISPRLHALAVLRMEHGVMEHEMPQRGCMPESSDKMPGIQHLAYRATVIADVVA